jgi:hypothetical protein
MDDEGTLAHARWECKYHVVFIPKFRRKLLYGLLAAVRKRGNLTGGRGGNAARCLSQRRAV